MSVFLDKGLEVLDKKYDEIMKADSLGEIKFSASEISALDEVRFLWPFKLKFGFSSDNLSAERLFNKIKTSDKDYPTIFLFIAKVNPVICHSITQMDSKR